MRVTLLLLLLCLATGCSSLHGDIRVTSRKHADVDLRAIKYYEWSEADAVVLDSTGTWAGGHATFEGIVREAVERELRAAGLAPASSGGLLRVHVTALGTRAEASDAQDRAGEAAAATVTEASLVVEIHDVPTGALVWRGVARSTSKRVASMDEARGRIGFAMQRMFADF